MNKLRAYAALAWLALAAAAAPARAQVILPTAPAAPTANIEGFTVAGKASIGARPNGVEIDLDVMAASELTADAIVKYRDAKRRLHDAFSALRLENVTIEERGLVIDQKGMINPYVFGMPQSARAKTEVQLARKLVVKCANIRNLDEERLLQLIAKLLDVAQDAGAHVGPEQQFNPYYYNPYLRNSAGLVRFILDDFDKLQEEAYTKAVADARTRAERLARLSHVALGPIVAIREVSVPGEKTSAPDEQEAPKRLETSKFQEIPVRVELLVRFEVHSQPERTGQAGQR